MTKQTPVVQPDGIQKPVFRMAEAIDLQKLIAMVRRRLVLMVIVGGIIFAAAAAVALTATPEYTATARVMLDTRQANVVDTEAVLSGLRADSSVVDTEVEVLRSRQLAGRVVAALNLQDDPEFNPALAKPSGVGGVVKSVRGVISREPTPDPNDPVVQKRQLERVVDRVLAKLKVQRSGVTFVIDVNFTSKRPARAAMIADKFAELYLLEQMEAKFDATRQATTWLNDRLAQLRTQVQADDAAVQNYRVSNNLLSTTGASLTEQEISTYNQQLASARIKAEEDRARLTEARRQLAAGGEVGEAAQSDAIRTLRAQRSSLSARVADLQGRYGPRHPDMLKAQRELEDIDAAIRQETSRVISSLEAEAQVSQQRLNAIQGSASQARGALASSNRATVRLNDLERTAEASKTLYESYLNRFKETSSAAGIEQSDSRILSKATIPSRPSAPNLKISLALGFLLGAGGAFAALLLAENLDAGLSTAEDVEQKLGVRHLGAIPLLSSVTKARNVSPLDYVVQNPLSAFAEAFRNLRISLHYAKLDQPVKVVAITSALPDEGKTVTSVCFARTAAMQGARVVLLDCDLRRRAVGRVLGIETDVGLIEVLSGQASLNQALKADETGAMILPLSNVSALGKDVFGTAAMTKLLDDLRGRFDLVVLDTAPVLPLSDTRMLAHLMDTTMFVVRWHKTSHKAVEAALKILSRANCHIAGVALSQVDLKQQAKYAYGDPDSYYYEYKGYYGSEGQA